MLTLTSRKKLPRFQNVIDQVRLFNLRIQIQMQCQFHLIEDLSKATAYFPIHGFRYLLFGLVHKQQQLNAS